MGNEFTVPVQGRIVSSERDANILLTVTQIRRVEASATPLPSHVSIAGCDHVGMAFFSTYFPFFLDGVRRRRPPPRERQL